MKTLNKINIILIVIGIVLFGTFIIISIIRSQKKRENLYDVMLVGIVSRKIYTEHDTYELVITNKNSTLEVTFALAHADFQKIHIGDSLFKNPGERQATLYSGQGKRFCCQLSLF
jgi:hypothetical protein